MTVEEVRGSLDLTDNGAIKNSIRNCLTVFQNDPVLQGAVRYNILTERIDIVKPLWWSKQTATLTDTDLNYLMLYLEDKYSLTSEKKIQKALSIIADSNKYHPIVLLSKTQCTIRYCLDSVSLNFKCIIPFCFIGCQDVSFLLWSNCGQTTPTNDLSPPAKLHRAISIFTNRSCAFCLHELSIRRICQPCQ